MAAKAPRRAASGSACAGGGEQCVALVLGSGLPRTPLDVLDDARRMDPYQVLGLSFLASKDKVRRAYLRLCRQEHPDLNDGWESMEWMMGEWAYRVLIDPQERAAYDTARVVRNALSFTEGVFAFGFFVAVQLGSLIGDAWQIAERSVEKAVLGSSFLLQGAPEVPRTTVETPAAATGAAGAQPLPQRPAATATNEVQPLPTRPAAVGVQSLPKQPEAAAGAAGAVAGAVGAGLSPPQPAAIAGFVVEQPTLPAPPALAEKAAEEIDGKAGARRQTGSQGRKEDTPPEAYSLLEDISSLQGEVRALSEELTKAKKRLARLVVPSRNSK